MNETIANTSSRIKALLLDVIVLSLLGFFIEVHLGLENLTWTQYYYLIIGISLGVFTLLETAFKGTPAQLLLKLRLTIDSPVALFIRFIRNTLLYFGLYSSGYLVIMLVVFPGNLWRALSHPYVLIAATGSLLMLFSGLQFWRGKDFLHNSLFGVQIISTQGVLNRRKRLSLYGVILGFISAVVLLRFLYYASHSAMIYAHGTRPKISSVKANMHTLQTMVETYYYTGKKRYPLTIAELHEAAIQGEKPYWKDLMNPYLGTHGPGQAYSDDEGLVLKGVVTYQPIGNPPSTYRIYGYTYTWAHLFEPVSRVIRIQQKGRDFFLSNHY